MTTTAIANDLSTVARAMSGTQAADFCTTEYARLAALLRELTPDEWRRPTDCVPWDVRAMAGHLVGAAEAASLGTFVRQALAGMRVQRKLALGDAVDGINEAQIRAQASRSTGALVDAVERAAPAQVRNRRSPGWYAALMPLPSPVHWVSVRTLRVVVLNRDLWIHRVDICRATGRPMELTADHDGVMFEDIVASWAKRHGQPYELVLDGPAGGAYAQGDGGPALRLDAVDFCRIVSGRAPGDGLLATQVLF
jgi:uncharacterized protein (TIGR03083 family)